MKGDGRLGAWQRPVAINTLLICDRIERRVVRIAVTSTTVVRATSGLTLITVPFYSTRFCKLSLNMNSDSLPGTLKKGCFRLKITNFYIIEIVSVD
jgi:hypothetical protein